LTILSLTIPSEAKLKKKLKTNTQDCTSALYDLPGGGNHICIDSTNQYFFALCITATIWTTYGDAFNAVCQVGGDCEWSNAGTVGVDPFPAPSDPSEYLFESGGMGCPWWDAVSARYPGNWAFTDPISPYCITDTDDYDTPVDIVHFIDSCTTGGGYVLACDNYGS